MTSTFRAETIHVHLLGAPSMGKTTLAAAIYLELKMRGVRSTLVQEVAQERIWEGTMSKDAQVEVTTEQIRRENATEGRVEVIVTESPPLLGLLYGHDRDTATLERLVSSAMNKWRVYPILVKRTLHPDHYDGHGRLQNCLEALEKAAQLEALLQKWGITPEVVNTSGSPRGHIVHSRRICDTVQWLAATPQSIERNGLLEIARAHTTPQHLTEETMG